MSCTDQLLCVVVGDASVVVCCFVVVVDFEGLVSF